ncbi:uncharacterized protein LOC132554256 [Ylistrum balloti]|uniref:uncharacterized protein LOC132554256 n=1 Tax=Ylistrum balloti TaxID=509963 RepID=UPI002905EEE8|nr:uncharacterized protein LOC132554256 [Ylistrum balloti]
MLKLRILSKLSHTVGGSGTRSKTVPAISRVARLDKMMQKMAKKDDRKNKWFLVPLSSQKVTKHHSGKARYSTPGTKRKAEYISDLLFGPISEIMCRGLLDARIKVELSQVSLLADFSLLRIHWLASDGDDHILIEDILQNKSVAMQDLVKELQIFSNVPPVKFVKDMSVARVQEVERLLRHADLGQYEATDSSAEENTVTMMEIPTDKSVSVSLKDISKRFRLDDDANNQLNEGLENLNTSSDHTEEFTDLTKRFRQDLYGINHGSMMQKLRMLKSGVRKKTMSEIYPSPPDNFQTNDDRKQAREQYTKMLKIRKNQRQDLRKHREKQHVLLDDRDRSDDAEDFLLGSISDDEVMDD